MFENQNLGSKPSLKQLVYENLQNMIVQGKLEPGETPEQALVRECREEIALPVVNLRTRTAVTHAYPDRTIHLTLLDCEPAEGAEATALEHAELGWFTAEETRRGMSGSALPRNAA